MAGNIERRAYDVEINSVKYRFRRGEGIKGLTTQVVRNQAELQEITGVPGLRLQSRADVRPFMQTDWSGGSRWELPLLSEEQPNVYYRSQGLDLWTRPGFVDPLNQVYVGDHATELGGGNNYMATPFWAAPVPTIGQRELYASGATIVVNSPNRDLYKWDPATNSWVTTGVSTQTTDHHWSAVYNPTDQYIYATSGGSLVSYKLDGTGGVSSAPPATGSLDFANVFIHEGELFLYEGGPIYKVTDLQTTPVYTEVADDGEGIEVLVAGSGAANHTLIKHPDVRLIASTPEGIMYVKNVYRGGAVVPTIYRIDRDSTGTYILEPIGTLPDNQLAVTVLWHLGALLISTVESPALVNDNSAYGWDRDDGDVIANFWAVTLDSISVIGSTDRSRGPDLEETSFKLIGSAGNLALIGGHKRIWVYDGARGGLHPVIEREVPTSPTVTTGGSPWDKFHQVSTSSGYPAWYFMSADEHIWMRTKDSRDIGEVTNFGDDTDSMSLESSWFDFGLPFEDKTITALDINTEQCRQTEQWTIFLKADDDAGWTQVAEHVGTVSAAVEHASYELASPMTGKRFRYKIAFEQKSAAPAISPPGFRGIKVNAISGDVTKAWTIEIDATEFLNLENEVTDPEDMYDDLLTLAEKLDVVTFKRFKPNSDTEVEYDVRVARVDFEEDSEGEFYARVVLVDKYTGAN